MRTIEDILSAQTIFHDLSSDQLHALAGSARYRRYRANELVFHDGELAHRFYVVARGKVAVEAQSAGGPAVRLQTVEAGEMLGWSWNHADSLRQLQGRALEPVEVIYFGGDHLRQHCDKDRDLGYKLFRQATELTMQRLQATRQLLLERTALAPVGFDEWQPGEH